MSIRNPFTVACAAVVFVIAVLVTLTIATPDPVRPDYVFTVCVDKSEKVEQAVSNAMHEVVRRDFVPTELEVNRTLGGGFVVRCRGIERGKLLSLD